MKKIFYSKVSKQAIVVALIVAAICIPLGIHWLSVIGVSAFVYFFIRLLLELGDDIPVESFILVIASLQWVVGPVLAYAGFSDHWKYYMYVPEDRYMTFVVPAVIMFSVGLYMFRPKSRVEILSNYESTVYDIVNKNKNLPFYLIGVGFFFSLTIRYLPQALAFPAYILSNLHYIGLIYLVSSGIRKNKSFILVLAFSISFISALRSGYFHDFLLWNAFIGMYVAYRFKPSLMAKLLVMLTGVLLIFVLQAIKSEYRERIHAAGNNSIFAKLSDSISERFQDDEQGKNNVERLVVRINQGWIISRIMDRVPELIPYTSGETVIVALKASLLPRFLYPDKPEAGGKENYEKYTGFFLHKTSMGISVLSEAYINFGVEGGWVFMLLLGITYSLILRWLILLIRKYPTIWLWLPLILLHFVKAETELLVQLNFLVKSIIVVILFLYVNKKFLKIRL